MTSLVHATSPSDFLAVVPRLLGFHPQQSIVLVPFRRGRSRGVLRLDLPPDDDHVDQIAATMIGLVCRVPEADGCAIVVYGDTDAPARALVAGVERHADACGVRIVEALWVAEGRWGSYASPEAGDVPTSIDLPPGVAEEFPVAVDQFAGADLAAVDADTHRAVADACSTLTEAVRMLARDALPSGRGGAGRIDPRALAAASVLDDLPAFFERLLDADPDALDPYELAVTAWALGRPALRDIALIGWLDGVEAGDAAAEAQARWEEGQEYPSEIAMRIWGEGARPSPDRLTRALAVARKVASAVPESARPGPLAVCGWLSWALGRSTHASLYASRASEIVRDHGLAEIVRSFVEAAHLPDWAFRLPVAETAEVP